MMINSTFFITIPNQYVQKSYFMKKILLSSTGIYAKVADTELEYFQSGNKTTEVWVNSDFFQFLMRQPDKADEW